MSLIDNYTKQELENIIQKSSSYRDVAKKIGYTSYSGDLCNLIKDTANLLKIDVSHFRRQTNIVRTPENIFIENSTANQSTLRRWYLKGKYTQYKCSICEQEPFWNGKELTLILDHINGENHDNRLENLRWVCPNCNQQLDTTNGKNKKQLEKHNYCIDCGKEIHLRSMRCVECQAKAQIIPLEDMLVTREELKELIRTKPFTQIGKQFNVSDNAIRKWCDKFNLPRKSTEIKKITDEEWKNI